MTCSCTCKSLWYIVNGQWNRIDSVTGWCQVDLTPLMHVMEQRSKEKLSWPWSHPIASLYGIPFFSLSIDASLLKSLVAALPVPPADDRTKGSYISLYFLFLLAFLVDRRSALARYWATWQPASWWSWRNTWSANGTVISFEALCSCGEDVCLLVSPRPSKCTGSAVSFQIGCPGGSWPVSAGMRWIADSSGRKISEVDSAFTSMTCKK